MGYVNGAPLELGRCRSSRCPTSPAASAAASAPSTASRPTSRRPMLYRQIDSRRQRASAYYPFEPRAAARVARRLPQHRLRARGLDTDGFSRITGQQILRGPAGPRRASPGSTFGEATRGPRVRHLGVRRHQPDPGPALPRSSHARPSARSTTRACWPTAPVRDARAAGDVAARVMHYGRYGGGGEDPRLYPAVRRLPELVRGYDIGSFSASECGTQRQQLPGLRSAAGQPPAGRATSSCACRCSASSADAACTARSPSRSAPSSTPAWPGTARRSPSMFGGRAPAREEHGVGGPRQPLRASRCCSRLGEAAGPAGQGRVLRSTCWRGSRLVN